MRSPCGPDGDVIAAWDAGGAAGFEVTLDAGPIPATGALGLVALAAVLGLLALSALRRRSKLPGTLVERC